MTEQHPDAKNSTVDASPIPETPTHASGPIDATASPSPVSAATVQLAAVQFANGSMLGAYRIIEKLGEGGMGAVYKAEHTSMERTVAIKVLSSQFMRLPDAVARFRREIKAISKVSDPHIVQAFDAGEVSGTHYLAMEYVEGTDLQKHVREKGALSVGNACKVLKQAAQALAAAHAAGLVHRDVKPSNLLAAKSGQIKLLDLGLARLAFDPNGATELTAAGQTFGTPDYMAPEQWEDAHSADARADLYALGCTLFYLLVGRAPYGTEQHRATVSKMTAHVMQPIPDLKAARADVPDGVAAIYRKLMAKKPGERFQTANELIEALASFTSKSSPHAPREESRTSTTPSIAPQASNATSAARPADPHAEREGYNDATAPLDFFAQMQADAETQALPVSDSKESRSAAKKSSVKPEHSQRNKLIAAAFVAVVVVLAGIIIKITHQDGTVTEIKIPDGAKVEVTNEKPSPIENQKSKIENSKSWQGWPADAPPPAIAPFDAATAKKHQDAWAKYLKLEVEYTNSLGMKFVLIPPGEFTMGSTLAEIEEAIKAVGEDKHWQECIKSEAPQHKVILTQPIYLGVHEVTQADYEKVMGIGKNPSYFAPMGAGKDAVAGMDTSSHPVETVSWDDAAEFCAKLSQQEKLKPFRFGLRAGETVTIEGTGYRLPTEAEWEFACRAGTTTKYWIGDKDEDLVRAGWFGTNSGGRTHAVGELKGNPFGLSDIHGNVWEWVQDWWEPTYYGEFQEKPALDPSGPSFAGSQRVLRGGNWFHYSAYCRASNRLASVPPYRLHHLRFSGVAGGWSLACQSSMTSVSLNSVL